MDEIKLALEMNKLVHNECKDVPHDIGLRLLEVVKKHVGEQLNLPPVMRSLLLKYQEEWKKAKANSKRTTKGGYEKVDMKEWGKMEAFAMIMDDLARLQ